MQKSKGSFHVNGYKKLQYSSTAWLDKLSWLGSVAEAGEPVEDQEAAGEDEEDKEPDAGGLRDDGDGDRDMEGSLYSALAVVELEGEGAGVPDPEAGDVEVGDVAVALTVVPENLPSQLNRSRGYSQVFVPAVSCRVVLSHIFLQNILQG